MSRPFVPVGISFFTVLFLFSYFGIYAAAAAFFISLVTLIVVLIIKKKSTAIKAMKIVCISVMAASALFAIKTELKYIPTVNLCDGQPHSISGTLSDYSDMYGKYYYTLNVTDIDGNNTDVRIRVISKYYMNTEIDDILYFNGVTFYPLGQTEQSHLNYKADSIYIGAYGAKAFSVTKAEKHSARFYFSFVKNKITDKISDYLPSDEAAVCSGMLTGDKTGLRDELTMNFRYSGISHLFAVSGFHLSLWASVILFLFSSIFKKHKNAGALFSILFVILFMGLTGFTKSVTRAGIMIIVTLFGKVINQKSDPLNSLFFALTLVLSINPFGVTSTALQMSFLSTLGIIILSPSLSDISVKVSNKIKNHFFAKTLIMFISIFAISIISILFIMPVSAFSFGYYSAAAPICNLLCMIPAELTILLSGLFVIFSWCAPIAKPLVILTSSLVRYIINITDKISHIKNAVISIDSTAMKISVSIIILVFILCLVIFSGKTKKLLKTVAFCTLALTTVSVISSVCNYNTSKIEAVDVGDGLSVIMTIEGKTYLISCGGDSNKDYSLTNILDKVNTRKIDLLLIPRNTETESEYAETILSRYDCNVIISEEKYRGSILDKLPNGTVTTNFYSGYLNEETSFSYINNDNFKGVRIENPDFTCTVLLRPVNDFSLVPQSWCSGDILISRAGISDKTADGFSTVFISTSKDIKQNENIYSTKTSGNLTFTVLQKDRTSVREDNYVAK